MREQTYQIKLGSADGPHVPTIESVFGRVNVILGVNGAGKSTTIDALKAKAPLFGANRPVIYVEGGRAVPLPDAVEVDAKTFAQYGTLEQATAMHTRKRSRRFTDRVKDALFVLLRRGETVKLEHSDAVTQWLGTGQRGECPTQVRLPLDRLFDAFNEVFPEISLELIARKQFRCRKGTSVYGPSKLSDGERQVLAILADIALLAEPNSVVLVDEPELNLHPRLANRLWERIEADLAEATFVYATHSIGFAMRDGVSRIIALGTRGGPALDLANLKDLDATEVREFLGAVPAFVGSAATLLTEGQNDDSFDSIFYRWVVQGRKAEVVCLGGCGDVRAASMRSGVWGRVAAGVSIVGIIDRDFRSDGTIAEIASAGCIVLELHEAESYLCHPRLLSDLGHRLALVEKPPSEATLLEVIRGHLRDRLVRVAAQRTFERAQVRLAVSLEKRIWREAHTADGVRRLLAEAAKLEAEKSHGTVGEAVTTSIFDEELRICGEAIDTGNVMSMLRLAPGKALLNQLAPLIGCKDAAAVARSSAFHLRLDDYDHLARLRATCVASLPDLSSA